MRYRVGWPVPERVLALTHFDPVVTEQDFAAIMTDTHAALQAVAGPFHMLIDNRLIADHTIAPLETILQVLPEGLPLRWIVMVLPDAIKDSASAMPVQGHGDIRLKHVASLAAAFEHLRSIDQWPGLDAVDCAFFEPAAAEWPAAPGSADA